MADPADPCYDLLARLRQVVAEAEAGGDVGRAALAGVEVWVTSADWPTDKALAEAQALLVRLCRLRAVARDTRVVGRSAGGAGARATLRLASGGELEASVLDVSAYGVRLLLAGPLTAGTAVAVPLAGPGGAAASRGGKVVWSSGGPAQGWTAGVRFDRPLEDAEMLALT